MDLGIGLLRKLPGRESGLGAESMVSGRIVAELLKKAVLKISSESAAL